MKEKMFSQIANYPSVFLSVDTREVSGQIALSSAESVMTGAFEEEEEEEDEEIFRTSR